MRTTSIYKEFIFLNDKLELTSSVNTVMDYVEQCTGASSTNYYDLYFKIKSISVELLTNAFKHAKAETVKLIIDSDENNLIIKKHDCAEPVTFIEPGLLPDGKKQLSYDIMCRLFAKPDAGGLIRFFIEECTDDEWPDINNVSEHFGLLIITKCANEFTYYFDPQNQLNIFTAKIDLPVM